MLGYPVARCHITGITPYSQSRAHDAPELEREGKDAYDARTWRSKLNIGLVDGKKVVVIPAHGLHQSIAAAAKYSKRQIPGQGKATWTAKFAAGIGIFDDPVVLSADPDRPGDPIDPDSVNSVTISANADGVRGSGKRVTRRFPIIPLWESRFDVTILDPIITEDVFKEMLEIAGMFIGIGRFRPEKGGTNGRFKIAGLEWEDNRRLAA